jgi:hypothetical protein
MKTDGTGALGTVLLAAVLLATGCASDVVDEGHSNVDIEPSRPPLQERIDRFLLDQPLAPSTRRALIDFAREQRAIASAIDEGPVTRAEARMLRGRRARLRAQAENILVEMPESTRAALHRERLTVYNLAGALARAEHTGDGA